MNHNPQHGMFNASQLIPKQYILKHKQRQTKLITKTKQKIGCTLKANGLMPKNQLLEQ